MSQNDKKFTLGFIFTPKFDKVLLIHKTHPDSQAGRINGLGGLIENGEDIYDCIVREIKEESNLETNKNEWIFAGKLDMPEYPVYVLGYIYNGSLNDASSQTEEKIEWFDVDSLPKNVMDNMPWLIPLLANKLGKGTHIPETFNIKYSKI